MNHTIIKKALNEALTQKYYDELMNCEDEEHIFGTGFTADMKRLIRKTDDKLLYYSKYAAIAACACIAIGCAVLLPNLMNSGIRTEPTVTTTPAVESAPDTGTSTSDTTLPIIVTTPEDTTTAVVTKSPEETTADSVATEITTVITTTDTTTAPITTTEEKADNDNENPPTPAIPDDEPADADGDIIDDGEQADLDGDVIVDEEDDSDSVPPLPEEGDAETDADIDADDDVEVEADEEEEVTDEDDTPDSDDDVVVEDDDADEDVSTDTDDDVVIEEDDDEEEIEDDEVEIEDDEVVEDKPVTTNSLGETIAFFMWGNPLEDIDGRIYTNSVHNIGAEGANYSLDATKTNLDFVTEYILSNKTAPRITDEEPIREGEYLSVNITDIPANSLLFSDWSSRNRYEWLFADGYYEEVCEDEEDLGNGMNLLIYRSGFIVIDRYGYKPVYIRADSTSLFETLDNRGFSKAPATVGDMMNDIGFTADNIYRAYGSARSVYDLEIYNANFDVYKEKAELYAFVDKLKGKTLNYYNGDIDTQSNACKITYGLNTNPAEFNIVLTDNQMSGRPALYFTDDGRFPYGGYYFIPTQSEIEEFLTLICKAENLSKPVFFKNFGEYVKAVKYFTKLQSAEFVAAGGVNYEITDAEKLNELYNIIVTEAAKAEYIPFRMGVETDATISISSNAHMFVGVGDIIEINYNYFQGPPGFNEKITDFIKKNGKITISDIEYEDEEDVEVEDDVTIEEEIDE